MDMITLDAIKQLASDKDGLNLTCYSGLLYLLGKDRMDIILGIKTLMRSCPNKYTPAFFEPFFADKEKLIKRFDSILTPSRLKAEEDEQEYIEKKLAYDIGESTENPDAY